MSSSAADRFAPQLVAGAGDGIIIADGDGLILLWNSGAETIFGFPATEAVGKSLDLIIPERLRERHWEGYRATMRSGVTSYADRLLAVPAIRRDGSRISIEFRVTLLNDAAGRPEAIAAVVRDVTERWEADRELHRRLAELEARRSMQERSRAT